jgi:AraC family transcriptional regulator
MRGQNDTSQMQAESHGEVIRLHLLRVFSPDAAAAPNGRMTRPFLNKKTARLLREFIHDQLGEPLALNDLAELAEMTTHQLLIAFRRAFGSTPAQYIIQQRLCEAQRQLHGARRDITTIALDCGFASRSHLTACFSRHLGVSPSEWRSASFEISKAYFMVRDGGQIAIQQS